MVLHWGSTALALRIFAYVFRFPSLQNVVSSLKIPFYSWVKYGSVRLRHLSVDTDILAHRGLRCKPRPVWISNWSCEDDFPSRWYHGQRQWCEKQRCASPPSHPPCFLSCRLISINLSSSLAEDWVRKTTAKMSGALPLHPWDAQRTRVWRCWWCLYRFPLIAAARFIFIFCLKLPLLVQLWEGPFSLLLSWKAKEFSDGDLSS